MSGDRDLFGICHSVKERVIPLLGKERQSVAHQLDHLLRVLKNAEAIAVAYPAVDMEILTLAVLLHDVDQPFDDKANHVAYSESAAQTILAELAYPQERTRRVLQAIREHSTETIAVNRPSSIEARILFDADKLDGIGAFGVLRVFALAHQMGRSVPEAIAWYRRKIEVALPHMQTSQGREVALRRLPLVERFLAELERELD